MGSARDARDPHPASVPRGPHRNAAANRTREYERSRCWPPSSGWPQPGHVIPIRVQGFVQPTEQHVAHHEFPLRIVPEEAIRVRRRPPTPSGRRATCSRLVSTVRRATWTSARNPDAELVLLDRSLNDNSRHVRSGVIDGLFDGRFQRRRRRRTTVAIPFNRRVTAPASSMPTSPRCRCEISR